MFRRFIPSIGGSLQRPFTQLKFISRDALDVSAYNTGNTNFSEFVDARLVFPPEGPKFASLELVQRVDESGNAPSLRIPLVWLRDHCQNAGNFNHSTNQRRDDCTTLFEKAALAEDCYPLKFDQNSQKLRLFWADGEESSFSVRDLLDWALFSKKRYGEELDEWEASECPSRTLWTSESLKETPSVSSKDFDFAMFARLFIRFGSVSVTGVDSRDERATRELCESIAPIHSTFFGDFWTFGTSQEQSLAAFEDTAYGSEAIGPHTDGTYMDQPPGIQVFHCLKPAVQGGLTLLVDGFAAAERLRTERADLFRVLAETAVEHHYLEAGKLHARALREPVIREFPQAEKIAQIRYNPYDRAPMRTLQMGGEEEVEKRAIEETVRFYEAYQHFARLVNHPAQQVQLRLRPGTVLFIDNFRVLHGRQAFQGERAMCGCYLSRDCFLAKARPCLSPTLYRNV